MFASDSSREHVERDPRNDPRGRPSDEIVVDRKPIIADRSRVEQDAWPTAPIDRRRSERRRIERMGTDI